MDSKTRILYWLFEATKGGPTRMRILRLINKKPINLRKISIELDLDYKTVQEHIKILLDNGIIDTPKKGYGSIYFISVEWENNDYMKNILRGFDYGEKNKKRK